MSRSLGNVLPPPLLERLDGRHPGRLEGVALPLCTVDPGGWPHVALLSATELVAHDDGSTLSAALYGDSQSSANLRRTGRCTLLLFDTGLAACVKAEAREGGPTQAAPAATRFELRVVDVLLDAADPAREGEAAIAHGVRFVQSGTAELARRELLEELRRKPAGHVRDQ